MNIPVFQLPIINPPADWRDSADWQFESFALHMHETHCSSCGSVHHHSEAFRMFVRKHPAATDRRFIPALNVPKELSIVTFKLPVKVTPICHFCITSDRTGEQKILVSDEQSWRRAIEEARVLRTQRPRTAANSVDRSAIPDL